MWSDNETKQDLLGFKVHADLVKEVVLDEEILPTIIGVFGDWGSGKSSVLKIIQDDLQEQEEVECLYFNGWMFEGYDDAKAALLESILKKLADEKKFKPEIKHKATELLKSVNWMRTVHLGFKNVGLPVLAAYLTGGTSLIGTAYDKLSSLANKFRDNPNEIIEGLKNVETDELVEKLIKSKLEEPEIGIRKFREKFSALLKETNIKSLVILIDDLDRCSPERIIENLEAIKLFLNVDNTAFVIGADQRLIEQAIESKYGENNRLVKEYLEKVIQIPYHLPKLSSSEVETYMALLFCKRELKSTEFDEVVHEFKRFRETDRYSVFSFGKIKAFLAEKTIDVPDKLEKGLLMVKNISPLITKGLEGNPRQIKRYLNAFTLRKKLASVANLSDFQDDVLVKLMILEYTESDLFEELYKWQANEKGFPNQIKKLEKNYLSDTDQQKLSKINGASESWVSDKMVGWIKLSPPLSKIDLRDYFWITRDKLSESVSGLFISPIVRNAIKELCDLSPSEKLLNQNINSYVTKFTELELDSFYKVLESRATKEAEEKLYYDIYIALIANNIKGSEVKFLSTLRILIKSAPPSPARRIVELSNKNTIIKSFIEEELDDSTKLGKAIKMQLNKQQ